MAYNIAIDVQHLMTVRVVEFESSPDVDGVFDVTFQVEADKTRSALRVKVPNYGAHSDTVFGPLYGTDTMTSRDAEGNIKPYDDIVEDAWKVVRSTTDDNVQNTHADFTWDHIETWVRLETEKPSPSDTLNLSPSV